MASDALFQTQALVIHGFHELTEDRDTLLIREGRGIDLPLARDIVLQEVLSHLLDNF